MASVNNLHFLFELKKNPDIAFNIKFSKLKTINRREYKRVNI